MKPQIFSGPNELKILFCPQRESLATTLLILVRAGTDLENKKNNGISHFIEHLYFKGSKNYPSAKILLENIDKIGGTYNAFTSYEFTGFYLKVLPEYTESALDILSDIILHPLFPEEEIEKERKVIIEEINLYEDSPARLVIDLGMRIAFGDQPAGWPILGTKETISQIKRKDILNYVSNNYSAKNTLIVLSGRIENQNKLFEIIKKKFKNYNPKSPKAKPKFKRPKEVIEEKIYHRPKLNQAHTFLGFPLEGFLKLKNERYVLNLISSLLGEKASSRLWLKVREELGGAYYIRSGFEEYSNRSLFFIHAGLDLKRLPILIEEIIKEIDRLKKEGPSKEEIENSKTVLKSSLFMGLEDSLALALFYGKQFLVERTLLSPQEIGRKIFSLKKEDIEKGLQKFLSFKNLKAVFVLPEKENFKISDILKKFLK